MAGDLLFPRWVDPYEISIPHGLDPNTGLPVAEMTALSSTLNGLGRRGVNQLRTHRDHPGHGGGGIPYARIFAADYQDCIQRNESPDNRA